MSDQDKEKAGETPALHGRTPVGWHYRGYLPHFDAGEIWQTVTLRLADSFPTERLEAWKWELRLLSKEQAARELHRRIEDHLDQGHGACHLRRPHRRLGKKGSSNHPDHQGQVKDVLV